MQAADLCMAFKEPVHLFQSMRRAVASRAWVGDMLCQWCLSCGALCLQRRSRLAGEDGVG